MKNLIASIGKAVLAACILLAVLAILSGVVAVCAKTEFGTICWRSFAGMDGIVLLMIGVLLLTNRGIEKKHFSGWEKHFPKLPFICALMIVALVLTAAACLVNYLVV